MKIERGLSEQSSRRRVNRLGRFVIFGAAVALHLILIFTITIQTGEKKEREDTTIFKVVDLEEYVPPPPEPEKEEKKPEPEEKVEVPQQETVTEDVIEKEEEVEVVEEEAPAPQEGTPRPAPEPRPEPVEYLPQHKISVPPRMPTEEIRNKITYPTLANRQKIEGVVFLELYIDKTGVIQKIVVLKDPGYGFAEAAVKALEGMKVEPAEANGVPVAVRFRYPIRFTIK